MPCSPWSPLPTSGIDRKLANSVLSPHSHPMRDFPLMTEPLPNQASNAPITLSEFQQLIRAMYFTKDEARGVEGTFMWLMEEVGELAAALREGDRENCIEEFADVLAWLTTIANVAGVDLTEAVRRKYGTGCPGCRQLVCVCPDEGKP
jgi:NTP pyrophosphatase (non-canonical NTP hydrolase)